MTVPMIRAKVINIAAVSIKEIEMNQDYIDACDREAFARFMEENDEIETFMSNYTDENDTVEIRIPEDDDLKLLDLTDPI